MPFFDTTYLIYVMPFILLAMYAQYKVNSNYNQYSQVRNSKDMTGAQAARIILDRNNLQHVAVLKTAGVLSDHYDPRKQTISLSSGVYDNPSISAISIAAHEVGHAIQHDKSYVPLKIRSLMAPVVSFASNFVWIFIVIGFIISPIFVDIGIAIFIGVLLFQLVTLPVEFNASSRAIKELENGLISIDEKSGAKKVLQAAALTYIAATLVTVGQLARIFSLSGRRNNRR